MSQLGEGTNHDHTYSMGWPQEYHSQHETRYICGCGSYHCNQQQPRKLFVPQIDKSTQTENLLCDSHSEEWTLLEDIDIDTEEHKVCVMTDVVSHMELKENEYRDNTQKLLIKNETNVASQESCMPPGMYRYQDRIRPCYVKEEVAPETNFVSPGYDMKCNFQNNSLSQAPICLSAQTLVCPCGVCGRLGICNTWTPGINQVDEEVQADAFEYDFPVKCITCGIVIEDRNSCQRRFLVPVYECNLCVERGVPGPVVPSYLESVAGHNIAATTGAVPCEYCGKCFQTVKGMRIHKGRVHKGARPKH